MIQQLIRQFAGGGTRGRARGRRRRSARRGGGGTGARIGSTVERFLRSRR